MDLLTEKKVCLKCHQEKPLSHYYPTKFGGRINECAACKTEYHRQYRQKNRERFRAVQKVYKDKLRVKEARIKKVKVCAELDCNEPRVEFHGITNYCKSHAFDVYHKHV